jgi:hypothetical protein
VLQAAETSLRRAQEQKSRRARGEEIICARLFLCVQGVFVVSARASNYKMRGEAMPRGRVFEYVLAEGGCGWQEAA